MGNLTAKTSGEIASFMSPSMTNIKSLKVHFSPKQLGTGDPSPENVREIVGWDGVEVNGSGKNIAHIVGYSASTVNITQARQISNKYGTTLSTVDFTLPDTKLVVTQSQFPNTDTKHSYQNGYFHIIIDNLVFDKKYNISFKIDDITNNPLNATLKSIYLGRPSGAQNNSSKIDGNRLIFKDVPFNQKVGYPLQKFFEIRNCGMSFTLSEFMVTPADEDDFEYEPYQGNMYSKDWSSDVGTVYGGYVDLISGELVETNVRDLLDAVNKETLSTQYNTSQTVFFRCDTDYTFETKKGTVTGISDFCCESLKPVGSNWGNGDSQDSKVNTITQRYNSTKAVCMRMYNSVFDINADDTVEVKKQKINTWLANNPIVISYKLAEPITHQLTPTQLQSFVGQNNFWSNADYVEIEYELKETEDIQKCRKKIMLNQPHIESAIDDVVNFTTNMKAPLKECKVYFNPIQEGSGDPSPDNVRNITGWDGVSVVGCGKNLVNVSDETRAYAYVGGSATKYTEDNNIIIISGTSNGGYQVSCKPNTQYTYSCEPTLRSGGVYLRVWELEEKYNGKEIPSGHLSVNQNVNSAAGSVVTFTTKANTHYLVVGFYIYSTAAETGLTISDFQLELGDTRTSYEPYQGITTSVNWSDEVGTVYGGYIDLAKGELIATHKFVIYNGQEGGWNTYKVSQQIHFTRIISDKKIKLNSSISNLFPNANNITFWDREQYSVFGDHNTLSRIYVNAPYKMPNGVTEWKEWLSANPLQICYELAEPIHYQLTPQQLLTFKGENNIWSDTNGQTEVKFWTH